ncbi:MAG TPA: filamentous hemagglutinin N-terminal domain-containing protein, partial [Leptolyngbyaceae cyanobacterium]
MPETVSATESISTAEYKPQVSLDSEGPVQLAQAITPANDGTGTVVDQANNTFTITGGTQAGANLFHSFEQFGLDAGQVANIISNPDIANVLGRVAGGDPSVINGLLQVTGSNTNLFLINPAGILFGPNSQINVPGIFTATTASAIQIGDYWLDALGSNDYAKLVSTPSGFAFTSSSPGAIINAGSLNGESVTLLGGSVINTGTINTPGGNITIAAVAGENLVRITQDGSLLSLELPTDVQDSLNSSSQALTVLEIPALLSGGNVPQGLGLVAQEGAVKLASTNTPIPTSAGTTIVSGTLDASNQEGMGGRIDVLGERVGLLNANLDVSGNSGGGLVRVGGDYQGQGTIPNADNTYINKDSVISADAVATGNGGQVFVWGDDTTQFFGSILARGGAASGDGGFIEVSGKEALAYQGQVDLNAPAGRPGQLLLDPAYVTIGTGTTNDAELNDGIITGLDGGQFNGNFQISIGKLIDALNSGDVSITASEGIRFNSSLNADNSSYNLSLTAPQILVEGDITLGGSLSLSAGNVRFGNYRGASLEIKETGSITGGNIDTSAQGGDVILRASGDIRTGSITAANIFFSGESFGSISISSGGSFIAQEGTAPANIRGQSVDILANRNIVTGNIESPRAEFSQSPERLETKVRLSTTFGDIQVGYIVAGVGGIDVDAGGHFRALNSRLSFINRIETRPPDDPTRRLPSELVGYIRHLGYSKFPERFDI